MSEQISVTGSEHVIAPQGGNLEAGIEANIAPLPKELTTPATPTGERYARIPTHFRNPDDPMGSVLWIVEPGTQSIDIDPALEGSLVQRGKEFLMAKAAQDDAEAAVAAIKPQLKKDIERVPGLAGLHYEQLGLGLTDIEQNPAVLVNEAELRARLGSDFYELAEQEVTFTLNLAREILDRTGKPLTPEYVRQLFELALEISIGDPEVRASILSSKTKTTVDKQAAAKLWEAGRLREGDLAFKTTFALTPDSKPRTAPKARKEEK